MGVTVQLLKDEANTIFYFVADSGVSETAGHVGEAGGAVVATT